MVVPLEGDMAEIAALPIGDEEWDARTAICSSPKLPALHYGLQKAARTVLMRGFGADDVYTARPYSLMYHVLRFQTEMLHDCKMCTHLPSSDASWHNLATSLSKGNALLSAPPHFARITTATGRNVVDTLARKYKAFLASVTHLRGVTPHTRAGLRNLLGSVQLWHGWYVSETIAAFSAFPGNTSDCLDPDFGGGQYTWSIWGVASDCDIATFLRNEPRVNRSVRRWNSMVDVSGMAFERRTGCNGVRMELCLHYLASVTRKRIRRNRALERHLTALPCHGLDNGTMAWDEEACCAVWKRKLGIPLFFTCDQRACCTTLCECALDRFISCSNYIGISNMMLKPIRYTRDCPVRQARSLALCMALHPRLGEGSPLAELPVDILRLVIGGVDWSQHDGSGMQRLAAAKLQDSIDCTGTARNIASSLLCIELMGW